MSFNAQSAITYNNACNYSGNLIKIILDAVRAPFGFQWTEAGVTAVMQFQQYNNIDADGMVGLKSLNKIISDLSNCGKWSEVSALKEFIAKAQAQQASNKRTVGDIIHKFTPGTIVYPFRFEKGNAPHPVTGQIVPSWSAIGTFEVNVKFGSSLSEADRMRYEYRQYIKGIATIQDGNWNATRTLWTANGQPKDIAPRFAVPPDTNNSMTGLSPHYKEDGKEAEVAGGTPFRFGYRENGEYPGNRFKNIWSPHPVSGSHLVLRDTPGYGEPYNAGNDPKINMRFTFRGVVVEVERGETDEGIVTTKVIREIQDKTWAFNFTETLRWWAAIPAVG